MMGKDFDIADKIAVLYVVHFGNKQPGLVTCKDCVDFKLGFCSGGGNVFDCMYDKAEKCEVFSNI